MNVQTILKQKGRTVSTIEPHLTIADAVAVLRNQGIGALVVSRDGASVAGILSERDVVQGLAEHGPQLLGQTIDSLMTRRVYTCTPDDTIADLMGLMTERRIRHLPVIEGGALSGIVSIGDVVKNRLDEMEWEASELRQFISG